jgi:hypothetical protein
MSVGATESTVGVSLGNALARVRAARGEKPTAEVVYQNPRGGLEVSLGVQNGKPRLGVYFPIGGKR